MTINSNYYNNTSRFYKNMNIIDINIGDETKSFPLMLDDIKFSDNDIQFFYNVDQSEEGRIDLISYKVYGNTRLWWAIARANLIDDLLERPKAGEVLRIPSLSSIERYI